MKFSYNWLKDLVSGRLPEPKRLAELLALHSFEVNSLEKMGSDWVIDIDVLPNRAPDCFSHLGIAREVAVTTNKQLKNQEKKLIEDKELKAKNFVSVDIKHLQACPRYTARVVVDVKVGESPKFIQERLKVCGLRPINNIVDITNYVMLETGQPLHAFDGEKLRDPEGKPSASYGASKKIVVRFAKKGERIITLDGEKYDLDKNILVIADAKLPIAIAGIKGGKEPEIDRQTKVVVIESANFNPRVIRKGSKNIDLKTDASLRFEHGIDPNLTETAINRTAFLMQEIANGKIAQGLVDFYPKKILPKKVILDLNYVERLLGIKILKNEIIKIFKNLGFKVSQLSNLKLQVEIPTRRLDISLPEDLIEEIGRIYGYEKILTTLPLATLSLSERNDQIFWEDLSKRILKELSFTEVYNYSFVGEELKEVFGYNKGELIEIENPVSINQRYLRPSLIPNLLINLKTNLKNLPASRLGSGSWQAGFNDIRIFELGKVYKKKGKGTSEKRILAGAILRKESRALAEIFFELKGIIDSLLNQLGISDIWYDFYKPTPAAPKGASLSPRSTRVEAGAPKGREVSKTSFWQLKKSAEIKISRTEIGFLGTISPKILEELKVNENLVFFEIDFDKLTQLCSEEHEFRPLSRYPSAVRDLAVLVPRGVLVEDVLNRINTAGGKIVRDVDLFDIYEGEELPEGKKNLAFHIIYQAEDKTLKSSEIDEIHQKIIKTLEKKPEWQVRK